MKTPLFGNRILFVAVAGFFLLHAQTAQSGEFVVLNKTYTYPYNGGAFDCNTRNYSSMPSNWLSPDNYWNGHFYGYFELIDIPSNYEVGFQMGIYQYYKYNGKDYYETCSFTQALLQGEGDVATVDYGSPSAWWQHSNGGVDFTKVYEFEEVGLAIWSHEPGHVGIICPTAHGGDDIAYEVMPHFMPCTIRVIVVAVSAGSQFSGWSNYLNGGCAPAPQPTPSYGIDYAAEKTNKVVPSTDEYSYSSNMSGAVSGTGSTLTLTPGQNVYFRTKAASACSLVSAVQTLVVPARPSKPAYTIDYLNEKTVENVNSTIEYSASASFTGANAGTGNPVTITPGQDLYFRYKATASAFVSQAFLLDVPARPTAPSVTIDYASEVTSAIPSTMAWSTDSSGTSPVDGADVPLPLTPGTDLYIWVKATAGSFASTIQLLHVPDRPVAPSGITIDFINERTNQNVTSDMEYSASVSFTNSTTGTGSQIAVIPGQGLYIRTKATASGFASSAFSLDVPVRPEAPVITIDYAQEKTAESVPSTIEYSLSEAMTSPVSGIDTALVLTPGTDLFLRYQATGNAFISEIQHLNVPPRPDVPSFTVDFVNEKTLESVGPAIEYSTNESFTTSSYGSGSPASIVPGINLYFRVSSTTSSFCSPAFLLEVPHRPSLEYTGEDTITVALFTLQANLEENMTGFDLSDVLVTNGLSRNLRNNNLFDVVPAAIGNITVSILPNSFENEGFASNEMTVYYDNTVNIIPQTDDKDFIVCPVPSKDGIIYIYGRQNDPYAIGVYSIDGLFLRSYTVNETVSRQIDLQDLPKGMYFIMINANDKVSVHKVILE